MPSAPAGDDRCHRPARGLALDATTLLLVNAVFNGFAALGWVTLAVVFRIAPTASWLMALGHATRMLALRCDDCLNGWPQPMGGALSDLAALSTIMLLALAVRRMLRLHRRWGDIALVGALGAALGGHADRLRPVALAALLGVGMALLEVADLLDRPGGLAAVVLSYGTYRAVLVVVDARLQQRIASRSRATVTSVAGLLVDVVSFGIYAAWALGELPAVAAVGAVIALLLPWLLGAGTTRPTRTPVPVEGAGPGAEPS